ALAEAPQQALARHRALFRHDQAAQTGHRGQLLDAVAGVPRLRLVDVDDALPVVDEDALAQVAERVQQRVEEGEAGAGFPPPRPLLRLTPPGLARHPRLPPTSPFRLSPYRNTAWGTSTL